MDFSRITDSVYVGTTPQASDYRKLYDLGVRLIINMRFWWGQPANGDLPGLQYLRLRTFDSPLLPIPMRALFQGANAALGVIGGGGRVLAHCSRGRHRSVAMAAAILIAQGHSAEDAMELIKKRRPQADPAASHIRPRILEFARLWNNGQRSVY
ncbi:MAG TPA: dual specificity protein phosphatase [Anaerolineales bacterium]